MAGATVVGDQPGRVEVEQFAGGKWPVVRIPGRAFPGIVIQGDSLSILASDARRIAAELGVGRTPVDAAVYLAQALGELLDHYARTLTAYGIQLPYYPDGS